MLCFFLSGFFMSLIWCMLSFKHLYTYLVLQLNLKHAVGDSSSQSCAVQPESLSRS